MLLHTLATSVIKIIEFYQSIPNHHVLGSFVKRSKSHGHAQSTRSLSYGACSRPCLMAHIAPTVEVAAASIKHPPPISGVSNGEKRGLSASTLTHVRRLMEIRPPTTVLRRLLEQRQLLTATCCPLVQIEVLFSQIRCGTSHALTRKLLLEYIDYTRPVVVVL